MKALVLTLCLVCTQAFAAPLPDASIPHAQDGWGYHRGEDYAFGLLISAPIGMASRPWIGLLAGECAGIANEARYGRNFNWGHLVVISAGSLTGYALAKWEKHEAKKTRVRYGN